MKKLFSTALRLLAVGCVLSSWGCKDDDVTAATLPAPADVRCVAVGESTLKFKWTAVDQAVNYHYQVTDDAGATLFTKTIAEPEVNLDGLTCLTTYRFRVMACGKDVSSDYSAYVSAKTSDQGSGDPTQLAAPAPASSDVQKTSMTIGWKVVANAVGYTYKFLLASDGSTVKEGTTDEITLTFDNLKEGTEYTFSAKSVAPDGTVYYDSDFSKPIAVKTTREVEPKVTFKFPANEKDGNLRAFPGAEGAGMYTTGGRGGKVIHVTNLNDSGAGSLREAISASGARIIVFDVAGIIELKSDLKVSKGDVTIAGQTAPGDGICLRYRSLVIGADNVIVRYIRSRPGVTGGAEDADGLDAIWGRFNHNVILDHCSMSWSTDECSSFYTNKNFTMQWCVLTESLHNSGHTKGSHGYGGIWGGAPATFSHNLVSNHDSRNPRFDSPNTYKENNTDTDIPLTDRAIDMRNNVVYNFCNFPAYGGEGARINFVGNLYKWGPASVGGAGVSYKNGVESPNTICKRPYFYQVDGAYTTGGKTYDVGAASIYCDNTNVFDSSVDPSSNIGATLTADNKLGFVLNPSSYSSVKKDITWLSAPLPIQYNTTACYVTTHSAGDALERIAAYGGASKKRDAVDARATTHAKNGTFEVNGSFGSLNGIIDLPTDVGGYPVYTASSEDLSRAAVDTDADGIPDYYEDLFGLDKNDKNDAGYKTLDSQSIYTNLEVYLHYLVQDIVEGQTAGGAYTKQN